MTEFAASVDAEVEQMKESGIAALPHDYGQFTQAAKCYLDHYKTLMRRDGGQPNGYIHPNWPRSWERIYWDPEDDPHRNLIKATALLFLESERVVEQLAETEAAKA